MACVTSTVHTQNHVESDSACTGGKKKGGSRLANMWSKAPAVKEKPKQAPKSKAAAAAPAVDADAALKAAQQVLQTLLTELHSQYTLHSSCCFWTHVITFWSHPASLSHDTDANRGHKQPHMSCTALGHTLYPAVSEGQQQL